MLPIVLDLATSLTCRLCTITQAHKLIKHTSELPRNGAKQTINPTTSSTAAASYSGTGTLNPSYPTYPKGSPAAIAGQSSHLSSLRCLTGVEVTHQPLSTEATRLEHYCIIAIILGLQSLQLPQLFQQPHHKKHPWDSTRTAGPAQATPVTLDFLDIPSSKLQLDYSQHLRCRFFLVNAGRQLQPPNREQAHPHQVHRPRQTGPDQASVQAAHRPSLQMTFSHHQQPTQHLDGQPPPPPMQSANSARMSVTSQPHQRE